MNLKIRQFRESMGLSQRDLAKGIQKSFRTIQMWERGESFPNAAYIWKLCEFFGTDPNTFLGWYDDHPRQDAAPLESDEAEIVGYYRESTPERKHSLMMTARDSAAMSKDAAERPASDVPALGA